MRKNLNEKEKKILEQIGLRLSKARNEVDITQEDIAAEMNVSRQTIYRHEYGTSIPDIIDLVNYCKYYRVSADEILFGEQIQLPLDTSHLKKMLHNMIEEL